MIYSIRSINNLVSAARRRASSWRFQLRCHVQTYRRCLRACSRSIVPPCRSSLKHPAESLVEFPILLRELELPSDPLPRFTLHLAFHLLELTRPGACRHLFIFRPGRRFALEFDAAVDTFPCPNQPASPPIALESAPATRPQVSTVTPPSRSSGPSFILLKQPLPIVPPTESALATSHDIK